MKYLNGCKVSLWAGMLISIFLIGCSSADPKPETFAINDIDKAVYKDLASKYKQLFKQNVELRKRLIKLEEKRQKENDESSETIKSLSNTIQLLEINLKQMNNRLKNNSDRLTQLSARETKPIELPSSTKKPASVKIEQTEVAGLSGEFSTPKGSKAIKTVPLLPDATAKAKKQSVTIKKENDLMAAEDSNSVFITTKPKSAWEDPDLKPPTAPINLKIVPGAKKKYQQAFKTYSNRDFKIAIRLFKDFVKRYPSDMDADNSQYWIGQSYYQLDDFLSAEHAFRKVLRNYQHKETRRGYKTPDAILMLGRIYSQRNQPIKGRYYFEQVIARFPTSRSAAKAKREVQSMSVF